MIQFLRKLVDWKRLAAVISGFMLAMCFPQYGLGGFVWIWSIPLMVSLWLIPKSNSELEQDLKKEKRYKLQGFALAYLCGFVFWAINLWWLTSMRELDGIPPIAAYFAWFGMSAYLSIYFAIWGSVVCTVGNPWKKLNVQCSSKKNSIDRAVDKKLAKSDSLNKLLIEKVNGQRRMSLKGGLSDSLKVIRFAVMHASLWVVLEWVRGWMFTGFTWNGLGVAFHDVSTIAQAADLVGVTGLSFLPILVASTCAQLAARLIKETKRGHFKAHWEIAFSIGLVSLTFAYGIIRIQHFRQVKTQPVKAMILQQNISQNIAWGDEAQKLESYEGFVQLLDEGLAKQRKASFDSMIKLRDSVPNTTGEIEIEMIEPDVVILPEGALNQNMYYIDEPHETKRIFLTMNDADLLRNQLLAKGDFSLIYGSNLFQGKLENDGYMHPLVDGVQYNSIAIAPPALKQDLSNPTEQIIAHGKIHLVPFGEYFPSIPFQQQIYGFLYGEELSMSFSSGQHYDPLPLQVEESTIGVIPAVCFEDTIGRLIRKFARKNEPQMIVNITNDGWFGTSAAAHQHMANAKFRAIELRRPMVRSANTGVSGVVDIMGSLTDQKTRKRQVIEDEAGNTFIKGSLFAYVHIPVQGELTLYAFLGDWFILCCFLLFGFSLFMGKINYSKPTQS